MNRYCFTSIRRHHFALSLALTVVIYSSSWAQSEPNFEARAWIEQMKVDDRGPFSGIRWFCNDGTIQPARQGCRHHGGGVQHGEWSTVTEQMRAAGYPIATLYSALTQSNFEEIRQSPQLLAMLLVERYLVSADDGWIFRRARFYRGGFQIEDEAPAAERLLTYLLADSDWRARHYLLLREAARLFPRQRNYELVTEIRAEVRTLAEADPTLIPLRNKIHAYPQAEDARTLRALAISRPMASRARYYSIAEKIDQAFSPVALTPLMVRLRGHFWRGTPEPGLSEIMTRLTKSITREQRMQDCADALLFLREHVATETTPSLLLDLMDASLVFEREFFTLAAYRPSYTGPGTRFEHLRLIEAGVKAAYGTGLLSRRTYFAARASLEDLQRSRSIGATDFWQELAYLSLSAGWSYQRMNIEFGEAIHDFSSIEPRAMNLIADRLRASPMLFLSEELNLMLDDAERSQGRTHTVFGSNIRSGLRPLNPGLATGQLGTPTAPGQVDTAGASSIYLVPAATAELPPAAGILTLDQGNVLSHVQLLARNLGIPNVVVNRTLQPLLESRIGRQIVLAVSPGGSVLIADATPELGSKIGVSDDGKTRIEPDLDKLDLDARELIPLRDLRNRDSGRTVGPKAARLGELKYRFPGTVADGVAIPFGVFAQMLEQRKIDGLPLSSWMKTEYGALRQLNPRSVEYANRMRTMLGRIRETILSTQFSATFMAILAEALQKEFGSNRTYAVFVRSDTNVEDSASFSGAGLNLTVPNVIGLRQIATAITKVWASPFTERAFTWRQALMDEPEQVYCSVLLMRSVPVEKSGVMVTSDIDTGGTNYVTVAVNEGIAGAVSNQSAETLRIDLTNGNVRLLSEAAAETKTILNPAGGVSTVPARKGERILSGEELNALYELARAIPQKYPPLKNDEGEKVPADIEFGFLRGKLALFQIRPFLNSSRARLSRFLVDLDRSRPTAKEQMLNLDARIGNGTQARLNENNH